jgi:hypothetical protein
MAEARVVTQQHSVLCNDRSADGLRYSPHQHMAVSGQPCLFFNSPRCSAGIES